MKIIQSALPALLLFSLLLTGCFMTTDKKTEEEKRQEELEESLDKLGDDLDKAANDFEGNINEAVKSLEEAFKDVDIDKGKKAVNFRKLKELLPEELAGLPRVRTSGSSKGIAGFRASIAEAEYKEDDQSVDVNMIDVGGVGMALMSMAAWSKFEVDEESSDGYKRMTTFDDHKALEECRNNNKRCSLNLLAYDRFILTLEGRNVDMKTLKKMVRSMDLDRLVRMAKDAAKEDS